MQFCGNPGKNNDDFLLKEVPHGTVRQEYLFQMFMEYIRTAGYILLPLMKKRKKGSIRYCTF